MRSARIIMFFLFSIGCMLFGAAFDIAFLVPGTIVPYQPLADVFQLVITAILLLWAASNRVARAESGVRVGSTMFLGIAALFLGRVLFHTQIWFQSFVCSSWTGLIVYRPSVGEAFIACIFLGAVAVGFSLLVSNF